MLKLKIRQIHIIGLCLSFLPFWWLVGIDQFVWLLLFGSLIIIHQSVLYNQLVRWFLLYLVVQLVSSFFIVENYRYLSFLRSWWINVGAFFGFIVVMKVVRNKVDIERMIDYMIIPVAISCFVTTLAIFDIWQPHFRALIANYLPSSIVGSMLGMAMFDKMLVGYSWFFNSITVRSRGFFLYPTSYSTVLSMLIPFVFWKIRFGKKKKLYILILGLMIINLLSTTSRVSIISLLVGSLYMVISNRSLLSRIFFLFPLLLVLLGAISLENVRNIFDTLLYARGRGSVESRTTVYEATVRGFLERPIFGWGTERDIRESLFPAGSHSYYLSILYKNGIAGIFIFLILTYTTWKYTSPISGNSLFSDEINMLLRYGRWSFIAVLINNLTDALDLDAITYTIFWTLMGTLVVAQFYLKSKYGLYTTQSRVNTHFDKMTSTN